VNRLYRYQADAIPQIVRGEPTYLGFDPGLGKSRTALEAAKAKGVKRLLIVAPASGRYVWERECAKWWPEMPFSLVRGPGSSRSGSPVAASPSGSSRAPRTCRSFAAAWTASW
jgi:hypothetical protein